MEKLVRQAQRRDADAFTALMQAQMQNMYKTARAILSNEDDAADAISETILTCWEKLQQLENPAYFRTWMTRILINKCRDLQRKRENFLLTEEIPDVPVHDTGYANTEWNEALKSLDEKYRLVILLYYVEGYKTGEISTILEIPESTVRTRLARGRRQLAREYAEDECIRSSTGSGQAYAEAERMRGRASGSGTAGRRTGRYAEDECMRSDSVAAGQNSGMLQGSEVQMQRRRLI